MAPPSSPRGSDGFTADITGDEARRRLRTSVGLLTMLTIGIVSAAAVVAPRPAPADKRPATPVSVARPGAAAPGAV